MTNKEFIRIRAELGVTGLELSKMLRMGKGSDRTIRRYESGETPIPGPVSIAMEYFKAKFMLGPQ